MDQIAVAAFSRRDDRSGRPACADQIGRVEPQLTMRFTGWAVALIAVPSEDRLDVAREIDSLRRRGRRGRLRSEQHGACDEQEATGTPRDAAVQGMHGLTPQGSRLKANTTPPGPCHNPAASAHGALTWHAPRVVRNCPPSRRWWNGRGGEGRLV